MKLYYLDPGEREFLRPDDCIWMSGKRRAALASASLPAQRDGMAAEWALYWATLENCPENLPLRYQREPKGRPYFPDSPWQFSLSHSRGRAVCAMANRPVGVDLEFGPLPERLLARITGPGDEAPSGLALFSAKESVMKWMGEGMSLAPDRIRVAKGRFWVDGRPCGRVFYHALPHGVLTACGTEECELVLLSPPQSLFATEK